MDDLRADDVRRAREQAPADKLLLALRLMAEGITLQRAKLAARHPHEPPEAIEARLRDWRLSRA